MVARRYEGCSSSARSADIEARNSDYQGVKFLYQHDHTEPIGRAVELREDASGYSARSVWRTSRK